jgi:type 1 fimbriae regulatory protein FimB/type 1 fimbriae regulatory protein FimE
MILLAYRHALRVSALIHLRWDQLDLEQGLLHVRRVKHGVLSTHPLTGAEIRALRKLKRLNGASAYVLLSERQGPRTDASVRTMMAQAGERAGLGFPVHPSQLRHGCDYKLANDQQDTRAIPLFLGYHNIQHTVQYTELAVERFLDFWRDEDEAGHDPSVGHVRTAPGRRTGCCRTSHASVAERLALSSPCRVTV